MTRLLLRATASRYSTRDFGGHPDDENYLDQIRLQLEQYLRNFSFANIKIDLETEDES